MEQGQSAAPRVAVIGCGYWGRNLVRNFAELGALAAMIDSSEQRIAELVAKHGARGVSFEEALADETIDAIVVATPGPAHFSHAMAALEAGKHVYVEKPLTLSTSEAEALVARAEAWGLTLMVGHILRHHPAFAMLEKLVHNGAIGRVRHVVSNRLNLGKILPDEDVIWSLAPHDLSMVVALLGSEADEVVCLGDDFLRPGITDVALLRLRYPEKRSAEIRLSWMSPFKEHKLTVFGETGVAIFDDTKGWDEKLVIRRIGLDWQNPAVTPAPGETEAVPLPVGEPLKAECRDFLEAIAHSRTPLTDGREGVAITRLLERAEASLKAGGAPR